MAARVLQVGINYAPEPTGIAPYATGLAEGLTDRGFDVTVLTARPHYPEWRVNSSWSSRMDSRLMPGIDVRRVRHYVPPVPTGVRRAVSELSFGLKTVAHGWGQPDLVVCTSPALLGAALALGRASFGFRRPATGLIVQDLYSSGAGEVGSYGPSVAGALSKVEVWALSRADGIVAIHDRFKSQMTGGLGIDPKKITVIRNWTHLEREEVANREAMRAQLGWGQDDFVVLHTGAMGEKQGLKNVVDAARLAEGSGTNFRFTLIGDGGQRATLEAEAHGLSNIEFLPPVAASDYASTLAAADVLLVNERPGVSETAVPSKLTSYFSSGLPTLAASEAGSTTAEEIRNSAAGIVVRPGSPQMLLDGVKLLSADPAFRRKLGRAGPVYCDRVLSKEAALDAYAGWVARLLERR